MKFEWDENKSKQNLKKHRIPFSLAITVFDDPFALIAPDEKHSTANEEREWIIGKSDKGVLVVVFTIRLHRTYRIISARKANKKEKENYEKYKGISI